MSASPTQAEPGSFRDPAGRVYRVGDRIFRTVSAAGANGFETVWQSGILQDMAQKNRMIGASLLAAADPMREAFPSDTAHILEHPALPLITYPYEWPFRALQSAALAHIRLHQDLLDAGFTLSDASAFNMQFDGAAPLHIDALSVIPYREGMPWGGYRQFLQHFLNPLALEAKTGVSFSAFFRATLDGVSSNELSRLLPWHACLNPGLLLHVLIPSWGERRFGLHAPAPHAKPPHLSKKRCKNLLQHLYGVIEALRPYRHRVSPWLNYAATARYSVNESETKRNLVAAFVGTYHPGLLLDIGCNTGEYAVLCLKAGAGRVIGLDSDPASADAAFEKSAAGKLRFTPLVVDIANPSPAQGWRGLERESLMKRLCADAVVALAIIHHLAIGRNIPLADIVDFIVSLAPRGLIEFVEKSDPQVTELLRFREDIFPDYTLENMRTLLSRQARIVAEERVSESGRTLFQFERLPSQ